MAARRKQKPATSQTRELFSDDLTQAETQTTGAPARENATPLYLDRCPVKFINVPVGGLFLLNGGTWQKIDANRGQHFIKIPGHEAAISGGIANFAPGDFVFTLPVSEMPQ